MAGSAYNFKPSASDADGDTVTFTIANKPAWAAFDAATGTLSGTPAANSAGTYANVEIAATDGKAVTPLPAFTITVTAPASTSTRTVALSWTPPTSNEDGSALVDLSGYKIHYGSASQTYTSTVSITNPGLTRYVLDSLPAGKYFVAMTSYNAAGEESAYSPELSVTVN